MSKKLFNGFSEETITFIKQLAKNNNKPWFELHKKEYEAFLQTPLKNLVSDMGGFMLTIDPEFEVRPAIHKTISGIYRDIRFSNDKSPFKTSFWVTFKRPKKEWINAPAYFFEITPELYSFGMGFYCAMPKTMEKFRELIDKKTGEFEKAISFYSKQKTFVLEGEKYKKIFDATKSNELQEWYQKKNFYLICNRNIDDVLFSPQLADELMSEFYILARLYKFLVQAKL